MPVSIRGSESITLKNHWDVNGAASWTQDIFSNLNDVYKQKFFLQDVC